MTSFNKKQFARIIELSHSLGWETTLLHGVFVDDEFVFYFSHGMLDDLYFQVNLNPVRCCAIYDIPHGIYTNWHQIDTRKLAIDFNAEQQRLAPIFSRSIYESAKTRKQLKKDHPEFFGHSWHPGGGLQSADGCLVVEKIINKRQ